jgi:hypothetical protein
MTLARPPGAHAYNPSYLGGRDQEDRGLKPTWANSSQDPISKKSHHERAGRVAHGVDLEFKLQYQKKKNYFNGGNFRYSFRLMTALDQPLS